MTLQIIKIKNMEQIDSEINIVENSGYVQCSRKEAIKKVCFKETNYSKQQKTAYFK